MLVIPEKGKDYDVEPDPTESGTDSVENLEAGSEQEPEPEPELKPGPDLSAQLAQEREARIRLEERLAAREREQAPPPPKEEPAKVFTRAQLRAAVNEGTIDEDQMEEIWSNQQRDQILRDAEKLLVERERKHTTESVVETETSKYIAAYPDLKEIGSVNWKRVKAEYDFLRKLGDPDNPVTELKALRAALGSNPDRIPERTASRRETTGETSGASGGGSDRPVDIWNQVPPKYKAHYKRMVDEGQMDLEQVKKELPYMKRLAT